MKKTTETTITNISRFSTAIEYLALSKDREDKAYKSFSYLLSNATSALELNVKALEKKRGKLSIPSLNRDPAMLFEATEMVEELLKIRLHKMAKNLFGLQKELAKEDKGFAQMLNQKINIGEAITEETVVAGKSFNQVVGVVLEEKDQKVLLQIAREVLDVVNYIASNKAEKTNAQ